MSQINAPVASPATPSSVVAAKGTPHTGIASPSTPVPGSSPAPAEISLMPATLNPQDDSQRRHRLLDTVTRLLKSLLLLPGLRLIDSDLRELIQPMQTGQSSILTLLSSPGSNTPAVKETNHVSLEYDPSSRRKVLNTYEILRDIGHGEHGKVKLARNLVNDELVAIKILSRRPKDKSLRMRPAAARHHSSYESKIRREIAIMKRCNHKYIVRFKEYLDDRQSYKIYLVLEYMDRGEIMWKRPSPISLPRPLDHVHPDKIPCQAVRRCSLAAQGVEDNDLLSNVFLPNLTFRQSRRVLRDVLLALEYLHMQGIVHRDIKPANLLVSSDYTVKISDFGVLFAPCLDPKNECDEFLEMDLAKTVGTPAFFAPELCQTSFSNTNSSNSVPQVSEDAAGVPRVNHKIDIWAFGVTLYCLLFGRVPFNADSEFALFDVIVHQKLEFPESALSFNSPQVVSETEFELAKDLLSKLLNKSSEERIDVAEIKCHPFVLLDLENDPDKLNELFFLNAEYALEATPEIQENPIGRARKVGSLLFKAKSGLSSTLSVNYNNQDSDLTSPGPEPQQGSDPKRTPVELSPLMSHTPFLKLHGSPPTPSMPNTRNSSMGRANSLLHDVLDLGPGGLSRESVGSLEAPQIETKRNVGGDLYLRNQSAIDAIKDIQKSDQKRRKSSLFGTLSRTSSVSGSSRASRPPEEGLAPLGIPLAQEPAQETSSKIKVGPISINASRRPSSVISLPLTESFASLDSSNDEYLHLKYEEFRRKKRLLNGMAEPMTQSDSALPHLTQEISEKFERFNLNSLMALKRQTSPKFRDEEFAPKTSPRPQITLQESSYSTSSGSHSSCSSASSSDSEEEGNLTLKFSAKVLPRTTPPFLTLSNRAVSHDSNLKELANLSPTQYYSAPFVYQGLFHDLEDVPESLIGSSSSPAPPVFSVTNDDAKSSDTIRPRIQVAPIKSSPLRREVTHTPEELPRGRLGSDFNSDPTRPPSAESGYYVNHYNKDQVRLPFPISKHLDERKSLSKSSLTTPSERPNYNRSNSITLGVLQHERSEFGVPL